MRAMRSVRAIGAILFTVSLVMTGCSSQDRVGPAAQATPRVLKLATALGPGVLERVAEELDRRSGGSLTIAFQEDAHAGDPDAEHLIIEDAMRGDLDLAWVGSRAWDSVGVTAFDALHAPLLIDSYDLEGRVLENDQLLQPMADALKAKGLVLVGVLPGPMRLLFGRERSFVNASDLHGATVGMNESAVAKLTFEALGATPKTSAFNGAPIDSMDLIEQQASSVFGNEYDKDGGYVTANVPLWPRPIVIFASRRAYDSLSETDRTTLREAVMQARAKVLDETVANETGAATSMCERGTAFVNATDADIAGLRSAVAPVYDQLREDPVTADLITRIEALKVGSKPDTAIPACATPSEPETGDATPADGLWKRCTTREEFLEAVHDPARGAGALESDADHPENYGCAVIRLDRGTLSGGPDDANLEPGATYTVQGDRLTIHQENGEDFVFGWRIFEDKLVLSQVPGEISPTPMVVKPWDRAVGPAASPAASPTT